MKGAGFWDVAPCRSCGNRRFGGTSVITKTLTIGSDNRYNYVYLPVIFTNNIFCSRLKLTT
jgi:hypothetical protein